MVWFCVCLLSLLHERIGRESRSKGIDYAHTRFTHHTHTHACMHARTHTCMRSHTPHKHTHTCMCSHTPHKHTHICMHSHTPHKHTHTISPMSCHPSQQLLSVNVPRWWWYRLQHREGCTRRADPVGGMVCLQLWFNRNY